MVNNTKYIGNAPIVGSKKTLAFYAFCDKTGKEEAYYWENPLGDTVKSVLFRKLFFFSFQSFNNYNLIFIPYIPALFRQEKCSRGWML